MQEYGPILGGGVYKFLLMEVPILRGEVGDFCTSKYAG